MALTLKLRMQITFMKKTFFDFISSNGIYYQLSLLAHKSALALILVAAHMGTVGYDYVEYYYLPDIETYYYVPKHQFVYLSNGKWIFATSLPSRYSSYNLYSDIKW
jgi:hypothetical protein